jgi:prevent-host-death family protein
MQRISARDAKNAFGRLIDMARAEPVAIEKHGRPVVVVVALEEYERLIAYKTSDHEPSGHIKKPEGGG